MKPLVSALRNFKFEESPASKGEECVDKPRGKDV